MSLTVTAPGKLLLAGEYAVLEGAPALVLALDRQARVTVQARATGLGVTAPEVGVVDAQAIWQAGKPVWQNLGDATPESLGLVTTLLEALAQMAPLPPMQLTLDTRAFFAADGHTKLGLGSSAALTVALVSAVCAFAGRAAPTLAELLALHRLLQGGHGSGVDVATSLAGGALLYRLVDGQPRYTRVQLPRNLLWRVIWVGKAASTGAALVHLADWRQSEPTHFNAAMQALKDAAAAVAVAVHASTAVALLPALGHFTQQLDVFGRASGIDIVSAEHRQLMGVAAALGVVYKPSGAGGGDIGVAFATDMRKMADFITAAEAAHFVPIEVSASADA